MPYTDDELESLLHDVEKDWVERKESWKGDAPEKSRQAVCAFANDLPNHKCEGVLFVGVSDKGAPVGMPITDSLLQTLADIKTDGKISPPPSITVEKRNLRGFDIAVVHVLPSDSPPVRYDGRCWIRVGPRRAIATVQEERMLSERRRAGDKPFDVRAYAGKTENELDLNFFREAYLPSAVARDVLEENGRSLDEQLASVKFTVSPDAASATNLGILVAGKSPSDLIPCSYVQFLRLSGPNLADEILDSAAFTGRIDEIISKTEDKFKSHNQISVNLTSGATEITRSSYPVAAFQQLFRNAVMHRTYEHTNSPIRVYWFTDRVEIHNPGGPFGIVTEADFGKPGLTDYRNPNLAEAIKNLGFAQRFGVGIATARRLLAENGNPPLEFETSPGYLLARMYL